MATLAFVAGSKGDHGGHKASFQASRWTMVYGQLTCNDAYPDGGYTAATLEALPGLTRYIRKILFILPLGGAVGTDVYVPIGWDGTNRKLMAGTNAGAELATNGAVIDGAVASILVVGVQ